MQLTQKHLEYWSKNLRITGILLVIWFVVTFVIGYYARELSFNFFGWPFAFYMGAQGSLIIYVIIIWYYARYMNNLDHRLRRARRGGRLMATPAQGTGGLFSAGSQKGFTAQLKKVYTWYTGGFLIFIVALAILEQMGLPRNWIGYLFLLATIGLYAGIGVMSRTSDAAEYYVAGRRVPALFNGMATGADWMSAASFIGMAGTLYLTGLRRARVHHGLDRRLRAWWRCCWRRTCASSASSRSPTSSARATAATSRASSASSPRSCARSPTWWRRSTAWASSRRASPACSSNSGSSWASAASWSARSWAACARSRGRRSRSTSS